MKLAYWLGNNLLDLYMFEKQNKTKKGSVVFKKIGKLIFPTLSYFIKYTELWDS